MGVSEAPPLVRLVPVVLLPPRRTALVPLPPLVDVVDVDEPDPRGDAEVEDPLDDEPELPEPEELDPLVGGADRTGCCSENEGGENDGAGDGVSRATACVELAGAPAGGGASVVGGVERGIA